jgi:UDP-N-acetylmuramoyl-tripeptide--D-alanyl-D-alanine ligase
MLELGAESAALHQSVGRQAAAAGVDTLLAVGQYATDIVAGFNAGVAASPTASPTASQTVAKAVSKAEVSALLPHGAPDIVLLKGSHSVGLESVADGVIARFGEATL